MVNDEKPLVVVKHSKIIFIFIFVCSTCWTFFCIFGVIIPIFSAGNFDTVWFTNPRSSRNVEILFLALGWIAILPFGYFIKNMGIISFYSDRLEARSYLGWKTRIFPYDKIQVTEIGARGVKITWCNLPSWSYPWQRYKAEYLEGLEFASHNTGDDNYAITAQKAVKILQQRVDKFIKKS